MQKWSKLELWKVAKIGEEVSFRHLPEFKVMWQLFNESLLAMWRSRVILLAVTSAVACRIPSAKNEVIDAGLVYIIAPH